MAEVASEKGYAATVVADVVARAGVSGPEVRSTRCSQARNSASSDAYDASIRSIIRALDRQVDA